MTIGIDIRVLARGSRTGVEEYLINLLPHLVSLDSKIKYKFFYNAWQKISLDWLYPRTSAIWRIGAGANIEIKEFTIPNRLLSFSSKYLNFPKIDKMLGGVDVFFSPHFLIVGLSKKCPRIITFHDLSFEHFPEFFSLEKKIWHFSVNPRGQARKADKIIAISESTKGDLIDIYKIPEEKIKVIYSGISEEFRPFDRFSAQCRMVKNKYNLPDKFILYFGTLEPRKNIVGLIKAFEIFKNNFTGENKAMKLVIAGSNGWLYEDIFKTAKKSSFSQNIIFSGFVEPEDKVFFYNLADLFVYPSFFEGFGFPPLEAMACGVPVITSNVSSLPEIVGEAGLMINPYNFGELAWAMNEILTDGNLCQLLINRGLIQSKKFSWQKCAEETLEFMV